MCTYKKSERLCNKKLTENLFKNGKSIYEDFFRIVYIDDESQDAILRSQIIVPKRNIAKAVDRNFIKRQIRESYRKNKHIIIDFLKKHKLECVYCKSMLCYDIFGKKVYKTENKLHGCLLYTSPSPRDS